MASCLDFVGNEYWLSYLDSGEVYPACTNFFVLSPSEYSALTAAGGGGDNTTVPGEFSGELVLTTGIDQDTFDLAQENIVLALIISAAFWLILKQLR